MYEFVVVPQLPSLSRLLKVVVSTLTTCRDGSSWSKIFQFVKLETFPFPLLTQDCLIPKQNKKRQIGKKIKINTIFTCIVL